MSVGLLIVTHNDIGGELLNAARGIVGPLPMRTAFLEVSQQHDPATVLQEGERLVRRLDEGAGVLILTDAFGSTPSNVAVRLGENIGTAVVSGVNLPMLLRVLNYASLGLVALQEKAVSGGRDGVLLIDPHQPVANLRRGGGDQ